MPDGHSSSLTGKQQMVLDYMRGNGAELTDTGYAHLIHRGSFRSSRSLAAVIAGLREKGLVDRTPPPEPRTFLTDAGRRA